jgi:hypothetical protein
MKIKPEIHFKEVYAMHTENAADVNISSMGVSVLAAIIIICMFIYISFLFGCGKENHSGLSELQVPGCMAFDCHNSSQLMVYPPFSGEHGKHLSITGCETCHNNYYSNPQHKNGIINGYNAIYKVKTPGNIVFFSPDVPSPTWNYSASTCTTGSCHGQTHTNDNWY